MRHRLVASRPNFGNALLTALAVLVVIGGSDAYAVEHGDPTCLQVAGYWIACV